MIDIFKYLKPKEEIEEKEEEEEKEKKGTEPFDLSKYIFPKGEITKEEPDPFDALNESIEENYKKYQSLTKKLEAYQAEYDYAPPNIKPTIAANFNKLVEEHGNLVEQLQSDIKRRDSIIGTKYKDVFMKFKQLTGLSEEPVFKPEPPSAEPKSFWDISKDEKLMELHKINFESFKLWFKELKESKDKIAFIKGEGQSPELKELREQYKEKAPYMYEKSEQWIENVSMIAVGVGMAWQLVNAAVTSGFKVKDKVISAKELKEVLERARASYVPETGKFKATLGDNDFAIMKQLNVFFKTSGKGTAAREMLEKIVEKTGGLSFPQQVNIFGGKLYAGVPIDEMVKSIAAAGKLTQSIVNQLKVMNPVDTGLVFQQLSMVAPAIASKVASQFVELIPQKITEIPKEKPLTEEKFEEAFGVAKKVEIPEEVFWKDMESLATKATSREDLIRKIYGHYLKEEWRTLEDEDISEGRPEVEEMADLVKDQAYARIEEKYGSLENFIKSVKVKPTEAPKEISIEDDYKLIDKWIQQELPKQKAPDREHKLKAVSKQIRDGNVPDNVLEAMHRQFDKTKDQETGEMLWWNDVIDDPTAYPRTGTLMDFYNAYENLDIIEKPIIPKKEFVAKIEGIRKEKIVEEIPEKIEPEPTPEEIRKVFMDKEHLETTIKNRELFYEKYNNAYVETKEGYDRLLEEKIKDLKEEGFKGVDKGGVKRDAEGYVIGRIPTVSQNPKWYRDFYARENKKPSNADLREIAREQLLRGHIEDYGEVSANETFIKLEAQLDNYEAILSDIKDGDYSFETPKNIEKLNEKLKEMEKENKKIVGDLKTELATLKAEREAKYVGLKEEVEAGKKVEVEIGIKKGLKVAKAELKGRAIKGMPEKEIKEGNKLIKEIQIMVKNRGFTKKQFIDIKMEKGGARSLSGKTRRMTVPQLKAVLRAVELARPRKIGAKQVVSLKTENKIQSLKDTLIEEQQMNEKRYREILKEEGVYKEPKYIDAIHFITEKQGKKLIYRLLNESNILKITEPYRRAREANPEIKKVWDKLNKRKVTMGERDLIDPTDLQSMRYYFQKMGIITGADFSPVYRSLIDTNLECRYDLHKFIESFDKFKEIIKDKKRLKISEGWILAKNKLEGTPKVAEDITEEEIALAKKVESYLKDSQPMARTQQFLDNIENLEKLPQYNQYRKEMNKAKDIFESKGLGPLEEYLKDQKWGVITSGYDPMQVISPKVRDYKSSPLAFGKGHIKFRTDIEYQEQEKDMIQRVVAYKKSMDNLSKVREKLVALFQLTNNNLSKFKNPNRIKDNVEIFARELRGYNTPKNMFDRIFVRAYAMAMKTIVMPSPVLSIGRNLVLGQNMAIGHDKSMLIDPRNKTLTKDDTKFVEKYVLQSEFMKLDWFESREKPWPGLGWLIKLVEKVALYPWSDSANRWWCFWGKINQVNRAFEELAINSTAEEIEGMMWKAKFSDFRLDEQMMAMDILALDGPTAMKRFISKTYTDDVHFIYQRAQRALAEMGRVGRLLGNLMLWARAYWEKLFYNAGKVIGKDIPFKERWRGLEVLSNVIIGGLLVGAAYMKVTGRREAPYHPLNLLAYTPGGLQIGTVEAVGAIYANIILAVKGDKRALASLATDFPHAADMFIPFYDYALRAVEASTDTKNIDIKALRKVRMLLDKEYKLRGGAYVVNRNALEKWQYFLAGAGVDVSIKEKEKREKEKGKFPTIKFPEKSMFVKPKFPTRP